MYESPIKLTMSAIQQKMVQDALEIVQNYGFQVDQNELYKALKYDRDQYDKGYEDAKKDVLSTIENFISMDEYYNPYSKHESIPISELKSRINRLPYEKPDGWLEWFKGKEDD